MATTSDFLLDRLSQWRISRIYGYPGDGINGILGALDRAKDRMQFTQVRHEEMAAFMACAHAKFTGEVGVCLATSGPGAIHLLNGLYDAKLDHQPVVAIVGQQARAALGGHYQQEVDLISLFKDVAHEYVHMASSPEQIRHLVDRAVRIAKVEPRSPASSSRTTSRNSTPWTSRRASTAPCTRASASAIPTSSRTRMTCAMPPTS
jgi:pyruvate dehydrogenase (quinone)